MDIAGVVGLFNPCADTGGVNGDGPSAARLFRARGTSTVGRWVLRRSHFRSTKE